MLIKTRWENLAKEKEYNILMILEITLSLLGLSSKNLACKTRENSNFLKKGKMVILVKIQNFSRSQMMKWTSPLEFSYEI